MRRTFTTVSFLSAVSSITARRVRPIGAAAAFMLLAAMAQPAVAQVNHNANPSTLAITPSPLPTTQEKRPCSPANAKKAAALKEKIERNKERIDGLNEKIANRKQQMEKIQPGSSQQMFAEFRDGSRLFTLAYDSRLNEIAIEQLTMTVNIDSQTLGRLECQ